MMASQDDCMVISVRSDHPGCSAKFAEDSQSFGVAHAPCSKDNHFNPQTCDICDSNIQTAFAMTTQHKTVLPFLCLKNKWTSAQKWTSKLGAKIVWRDPQIGIDLEISHAPYSLCTKKSSTWNSRLAAVATAPSTVTAWSPTPIERLTT